MKPEPEESPDERSGKANLYGLLIGAGFELAIPVVVFTFLGFKADEYFGLDPVLAITGAFLGMTVGLLNLWRLTKRMSR